MDGKHNEEALTSLDRSNRQFVPSFYPASIQKVSLRAFFLTPPCYSRSAERKGRRSFNNKVLWVWWSQDTKKRVVIAPSLSRRTWRAWKGHNDPNKCCLYWFPSHTSTIWISWRNTFYVCYNVWLAWGNGWKVVSKHWNCYWSRAS